MLPQWMKGLPGFRVYATLDHASSRLLASKEELRKLRAELDAVKARADLNASTLTDMASALGASAQALGPQSRLEDILSARGTQYRTARPFPHIVIDDFVDAGVLRKVVEEFSTMDRYRLSLSTSKDEVKYSSEDEQPFGIYTRALIHMLNAGPFLTFLEKLSGISGLIADPHLRGGGLHEIKRGGKLGVHADFNFYHRLKIYRRLNLIIYLNEGWHDEWGGHLELWEPAAAKPAARIAPVFNRGVIFDTSNSSFHGHPDPLQCPDDRSRRSIALYYYSVDYPYEHDRAPHTTVFIETPRTAAASDVDRPSGPDADGSAARPDRGGPAGATAGV